MANSFIANDSGSRVATYLHSDGKYRTFVETFGDKLLTLKTENIGNPSYEYSDFVSRFIGGFRLPVDTYGASNAGRSPGAIGYNPANDSIFLAGRFEHGAIGEFSIPALVNNDTDVSALNFAANIQPFVQKVTGDAAFIGQGVNISGLHYDPSTDRLLMNVFRFYDQSATKLDTVHMLIDGASDLATSAQTGYLTNQLGGRAGGWMMPIPAHLQADLGGTHLQGWSTSTGRASPYTLQNGPGIAAGNPNAALANYGGISVLDAIALADYLPRDTETIRNLFSDRYNSTGNNYTWTSYSECSTAFVFPGTRTVMVIGQSGGHLLYNPNNLNPPGLVYQTNDPITGYKGYFPAEPYDRYAYYWLLSIDDLIDARNGVIETKDVVEYETGIFPAPYGVTNISGGTYDVASRRLLLSCDYADSLQGTPTQTIAVYQFPE